MAHLNEGEVDLVIGPTKRRPEDDEATRLAFEADRRRPDFGKLAAKVLKMIECRKKKQKP